MTTTTELERAKPESRSNPVDAQLSLVLPHALDSITLDEVRMVQASLHEFSQSPEVDAISRWSFAHPHEYPIQFLQLIASKGYIKWIVPQKYGGEEAHPLALHAMMEEWSRKDSALALDGLVQKTLVIKPVLLGGSEEQIALWVPRLMRGELRGSYCQTESREGGGSDATNLTTRAVDVGDAYEITGEKMFITAADGNFMIVAARTGSSDSGKHGISAFAFEIPPEGLPGLTVSEPLEKNGQYGAQLYGVNFDHVRIPKSSLLGKENEGWIKVFDKTLLESRGWIAAQGNGIMLHALDLALEQVQTYKVHGKYLIEYEANQNLLEQVVEQINKSRYLTAVAAIKIAQEDPHAAMWASMAKYMAGENAPWVANIVRRFFGGNGLINEYGTMATVENDAQFIATYEGPEEVQILIIMREWKRLGLTREDLKILHEPGAARVTPSQNNMSYDDFVATMKGLDMKLNSI